MKLSRFFMKLSVVFFCFLMIGQIMHSFLIPAHVYHDFLDTVLAIFASALALSLAVAFFYFNRRERRMILENDRRKLEGKPYWSLAPGSELIEGHPDPVVTMDPRGVVLSINPAAERATGYSESDLAGRLFTEVDVLRPDELPIALSNMQAILSGKVELIYHEYTIRLKDGREKIFEVKSVPVKSQNKVEMFQLFFRDIEDIRRHESMMRLQSAIVDTMAEAVAVIEFDTQILLYANQQFDRMFRVDSSTLMNKPLNALRLLDDENRPVTIDQMLNSTYRSSGWGGRYNLNDAGADAHFHFRARVSELAAPDHRRRAVCLFEDVTKEKHAMADIRRQKNILENIISNIPYAVFWKDRNSVYLGSNQRQAELAGYRPEEMVGKTDYDMPWTKDEAEFYRKIDKEVMDSGVPQVNFEETQLQKDGTVATILTSKVPLRGDDGNVIGILGIWTDITERKAQETQRLIQSTALETIGTSVLITDTKGKIEWVNPEFCRTTGYTHRELIGKTPRILKSGIMSKDFYKNLWETILAGKEWRGEFVNRRKNGGYYIVDKSITPVKNQQGVITHFVGLGQDITERRAHEEKLQLFRTLMEKSADEVYILDPMDGRVLDVNETACRMLGYSHQEMLQLKLIDYAPSLRARNDWPMVRDRTRDMGYSLLGARHQKKDGTVYEVDINASWIRINDKDYIVANARDASSRKEQEEKARQSQKMEAIGRLAGGIAHDFNNLLTVINGNAELSLMEISKDHPIRADLEDILNAGRSAASLTTQLLTFSRQQPAMRVAVDMNQLIQSTTGMLKRLIGESSEFVFLPDEKIGSIEGDPAMLEQVLVNLAVNAKDAMPHGGKIIIRTQELELDAAAKASLDIQNDQTRFLTLTVEDTGTGMSEDVKRKIFEPFFTTKEKGRGTGLGLPMCYGIVKQMGGAIRVESAPGTGSVFTVYFPTTSEAPSDATVAQPSSQRPSIVPGTVVLVEDEPLVRQLIEKVLKQEGFALVTADNGSEALTLLDDNLLPKVQLVITDVMMPHVGGRELAKRVWEKKADVKILFISGYVEEGLENSIARTEKSEFLRKPFHPQQLKEKIFEFLGS